MHIILIPDSFKGSLSSKEAGMAMRRGIQKVCPDALVILLPLTAARVCWKRMKAARAARKSFVRS